ncbi:MAG: molybdopterin-guanine dinucleotide biosynthesis protein MobB [Chryseobacterium sp.]|nr:MAG: molybdopterin-guanine dinucleotide biosynthesis protein MobB [Chryseobacterium sp.]
MFINITSESGNNKGSSGQLVHYLDKEDRIFDKEKELWFNGERADIQSYHVKNALDGNVAKLSRNDAKFFLVNISPSQKEIAHLKREFGEDMAAAMKGFAVRVMDEYARNFNRTGIESSKDLLWFGKMENHRYYTFKDREVINETKKSGEVKDGEQLHVQIIVSRKDITNKIKLSPMNNSKGKNEVHSKKLGQFNRLAFKQSGELLFDKLFGFERGFKEMLDYSNTKKNGTRLQREQLRILERVAPQQDRARHIRNELAREVGKNRFTSVNDMLKDVGKTIDGFLKIMMEPAHSNEPNINPVENAERVRRKQQSEQGHGLSR